MSRQSPGSELRRGGRRWRSALAAGLLALVVAVAGCRAAPGSFDGQRAYEHIEKQLSFGPRMAGSEGNQAAGDYIVRELEHNGWQVEEQEFVYQGVRLRNIVAKRGEGPLVILGTHYDTRPLADRDGADRSQPVPGANDGGSGTAVLLELSRVMGAATPESEIWLVFFDGEDRGDIDGWDWCVGSQYFVNNLGSLAGRRPEYALVVDMVGDADQAIYYEWSSMLWLQERLWTLADELGYGAHFIAEHRYQIYDDHTAFLQAGMNAALIIDFDYPYWHTVDDTLDKISVDSLQRVGDVLERLLKAGLPAGNSAGGAAPTPGD
jgi:hypothetical protein